MKIKGKNSGRKALDHKNQIQSNLYEHILKVIKPYDHTYDDLQNSEEDNQILRIILRDFLLFTFHVEELLPTESCVQIAEKYFFEYALSCSGNKKRTGGLLFFLRGADYEKREFAIDSLIHEFCDYLEFGEIRDEITIVALQVMYNLLI